MTAPFSEQMKFKMDNVQERLTKQKAHVNRIASQPIQVDQFKVHLDMTVPSLNTIQLLHNLVLFASVWLSDKYEMQHSRNKLLMLGSPVASKTELLTKSISYQASSFGSLSTVKKVTKGRRQN